jgi:enoyl-CoA hydratase/carnithine racemase
MMLTGRVYQAEEGYQIGLSQYLVDEGMGLDKALELAHKICGNVGMTNFALVQVLPRIVEAGHDNGLMMEALMASIAQDAPEAKQRLVDFLEGRAKKVGE